MHESDALDASGAQKEKQRNETMNNNKEVGTAQLANEK